MPGNSLSLKPLVIAVGSLVLLIGGAAGCTIGGGDEGSGSGSPVGSGAGSDCSTPAVIGTDGSAEGRVVGALYGELLTGAGKRVRISDTRYASPADTARAVVEGRLDLAPAYETTTLRALPGGQTVPGDLATTLSMALPPGIDALPPAAAQNGVVLAVTPATAHRHGLRDLTDLGGIKGLRLGGSAAGHPDAPTATALRRVYGVTLTPAGTSNTADVLVLRGTDPLIAREHLVVLTDSRGVVPPEHVFPLISAACADVDGRNALARLDSALTTGQLASLASSVAAGQDPSKTARAWLRAGTTH
ncbi:ABC transporter substrate-binding protein [Streptomyces lincolnensis]|nr:ABC transporter substrate-binding protein [Streptomyces lincolnensis]